MRSPLKVLEWAGRPASTTYTSNGRTGIRQSVQEIFRPVVRSFRPPAGTGRGWASAFATHKPTNKSSGLVRICVAFGSPLRSSVIVKLTNALLSLHGQLVRQGKEDARRNQLISEDTIRTCPMRGRAPAGWNAGLSRRRTRVRVPPLPPIFLPKPECFAKYGSI